MARLGTRTPGGPTYDLHQGNLRVDERATSIGARVLAEAAVARLGVSRPPDARRLFLAVGHAVGGRGP